MKTDKPRAILSQRQWRPPAILKVEHQASTDRQWPRHAEERNPDADGDELGNHGDGVGPETARLSAAQMAMAGQGPGECCVLYGRRGCRIVSMAISWRHRNRRRVLAPVAAAVAVSLALSMACGSGHQLATNGHVQLRLAAVDLLVFAPHPDDEVIGAGGMLRRALESGKRLLIVFVTNGDGYPKAASALLHRPISALRNSDYIRLAAARQREAVAADHVLGVSASNLIFLGYPDGVLAGVYADASDRPVQSPTTGRTMTYGPVELDYHTLAHGRPAAYTRTAALADIQEILKESQPAQVLVTDPADQHPDHHATYDLVRDAIATIGFRGELLTFVIHSGPGWPWPIGPTPDLPFASRTIGHTTYPIGIPWPPPIRIPLTAIDSTLKLRALDANRSELESPIDRLFLESFVKSEEVFWADR